VDEDSTVRDTQRVARPGAAAAPCCRSIRGVLRCGAAHFGAAPGAILLPLGVHLADRRQGNYLAPLLGSVAAAGIGFGAYRLASENSKDIGALW
jgi:hypothetical protein